LRSGADYGLKKSATPLLALASGFFLNPWHTACFNHAPAALRLPNEAKVKPEYQKIRSGRHIRRISTVAKQIVYDDEARQPLLAGVSKLAQAVRSTLGPRGRNAVLDKGWGSPKVTKDGVTVAEDIELDDAFENLGAQLVKEAASKTNDVAGDGTTTATVLAEAIFREGLKRISAGIDPMALSRGIAKATAAISEFIG
jgi:hypothetical protein